MVFRRGGGLNSAGMEDGGWLGVEEVMTGGWNRLMGDETISYGR